MKLIASLMLLLSSSAYAQSVARSAAPSGTSTARYELLEEAPAREPFLYFGLNTALLGAGIAAGMPILPVDLGVRVAGGLSIGPTFTFSGTYRSDQTDFKLKGFGGQLVYNFGRSAIADGFFLTASYQRYTVSATQMMNVSPGGAGGGGSEFGEFGGQMGIPMEGSAPVNAFGAGLGYQWVWKSGLRLAAGVRALMLKSDSDGINLMGMNRDELNQFGQAMNAAGGSTTVDIPVIEDRSIIIPMPEISLGWAI